MKYSRVVATDVCRLKGTASIWMRTSQPRVWRDLIRQHTVIQSPHILGWTFNEHPRTQFSLHSSLISMGLLSQAFIYDGWRRLCKHQTASFWDQNKNILMAVVLRWLQITVKIQTIFSSLKGGYRNFSFFFHRSCMLDKIYSGKIG